MSRIRRHLRDSKVFCARVLIAALIASLLPLLASVPAHAGTLTSTSWSVMDPRTNIAGNRYDWGFTTASTNTLSRVTMGVPTGTSGNNRALLLNGAVGGTNNATTPDTTTNSITGQLDVRARARLDTWSPAANYAFVSKATAGGVSFSMYVNGSGKLALAWSSDGTTLRYASSPASSGLANNATSWVRATLDPNSGGSAVANFYTSTDGNTWSSLGTWTGASGPTIYDSSAALEAGAYQGNSWIIKGALYYADVRSGISGTTTSPSNCTATGVANCFNPSNDTIGGSSWTAADPNAETWTVNRNGTNLLADIGSDLSVMNITGLPAGGTAQNREIDHLAVYQLPSAQSVATSNAVSLGLAGFISTYTSGSNASAITTYDNSGTPVAKDSATTPSVTINTPTTSVVAGASPIYTTATSATTVPVIPSSLSISGSNVYYGDEYSSTVMKLDTTTGNTTTYAGNGQTKTPINNVAPTATPMWNPSGNAVDGSGNMFISDTSLHNIRKITGNVINVVVNTSLIAGNNGDGAGTSHSVNFPRGGAVDASGNYYFADTNNHLVRKLDTSGNLTTVAGTGTAGYSGDGGTATSAQLNYPYDVAINSSGDLFIADRFNQRIRKIDHTTSNISTVAGNGSNSFGGDGGAATSASISYPCGIALDSSGNLYIADTSNNRIRKVNTSGNISTIAGTGYGYSGDGGAATSAALATPRQVKVDASGNIYVADHDNFRIRKIDTSGNISTVAGTGSAPSFSGDGGQATNSRIWYPIDLSNGNNGDILIASQLDHSIRKFDQWSTTSTVAGLGPVMGGSSGDGGAATSAKLNSPIGVAVAGDGTTYIADNGNGKIRKITAAGTISTFATLSNVYRVSVNNYTGDIYASNTCQVFKYTTSGTQTLVAGNGTCSFSGDGGAATSATLNQPRSMVFDASGNVFIADGNNARIRMVNTAGNISTVAGGGASSASNNAATSANIGTPCGLAIDPTGAIWINGFGTLERFTVGGPLVTVATVGGGGGLAVSNGSVYMGDYNSQVVRKVANIFPLNPSVNADSVSVPMNTARSWPILSNDWSQDKEMDPSGVTIASQPLHGTVTLTTPTTEASTLQANYTPTTGYTGPDSFAYQACDTTRVVCSTATVNITVGGNQVTTVVGGVTEGAGASIGFNPSRLTRFRNYIFFSDNSYGTIRRYDIYSKQSVVIAGTGVLSSTGDGGPAAVATLNTPRSMAVSPLGQLYVADNTGNTVRTVAPNGTISSVGSVTNPSAVALGNDGTLYVSAATQIKRWNGSSFVTYAGTGTSGGTGNGGAPALATFTGINGLLATANGDLYVSDTNDCTVRLIRNSVINAFAGQSGVCGSSGDSGSATAAQLNGNRGLGMDSNGAVLIADFANSKIRKVDTGGTITSIATSGATLTSPVDVVAGTTTDFYVVDPNKSYGVYFNTSFVGTVVLNSYSTQSSTFAGDGFGAQQTQIAQDQTVAGIAVDGSGNVFFNDRGGEIRRMDATTGVVTKWATVAGNSAAGQMIFDGSGNVIFANSCSVKRRNADASLTTLAGVSGTCAASGDGGAATSSTLNSSALGLAYNSAGDLFIAEKSNYRVRRVDHATGVITTIAGTGVVGASGDGGPATAAQLNNPQYLAIDPAGNLFVADLGNNAIRMIDTRGYITTIANISTPRGLASDSAGNLYVGGTGIGRLYKIDATTRAVTTVAGQTSTGFIDNTTTATGAQFWGITGLAVQGSDVYVADAGNGRIRKAAGIASTATNKLSSATWSVVPSGSGHPNVRELFGVTPSAGITASKLTFTLPTGTTGSPVVVSHYGISGSVSASLSGTTLTLSFSSQVLPAGVSIGLGIEGFTATGGAGSYSSAVTEYDGAGSTAIGWASSNVVALGPSGVPVSGSAGYSKVWEQSLTASPSAPSISLDLGPTRPNDQSTSLSVTSGGTLDNLGLSLGTPGLSGVPGAISPVTPDVTSSIASGSFPVDRWGVQITSSSGSNVGPTGLNLLSGLPATPAPVISSASGITTFTITTRTKLDYLIPAGTYTGAIAWKLSSS